ncbi:hypothetical protein K431DRAFT_285742 [Polychaeton citri CBS 116435]|uniref:Cell wall protein n=1 Tax=Polychaeton citri CBS 116435 TaxID=1314669 RepID=A0A9P4Q9B7_9PEZI|nr:hypothetical protein K431DRAFT_285742 [Polychaeton citri CBS 116435]
MAAHTLIALSALAAVAVARTDLSGCTSTDVSSPAGASIAWYVPGTGELCDFLDCGGGRAPPRSDVPGCPQYTGTASYSPSYLAGYGPTAGAAAETGAATTTTTSDDSLPTSSSSFDWSSLISAASTETGLYTTVGGDSPSSYSSADWSSLISAVSTETALYTTVAGSTASTSPSAAGPSSYTSLSTSTLVGTGIGGTNSTTPAGGSGNSTISASRTASPSASSPASTGGAAETKAWMAGAGLIAGLGVVVAAL